MTPVKFLRAKAADVNRLCLAALPDQSDFEDSFDRLTRLFTYEHSRPDDDRWFYRDVEFGTAAVGSNRSNDGSTITFVVISFEGLVYFYTSPPATEIIPGTEADRNHNVGWGRLARITEVEGLLHAVGDNGQIFRRSERGEWSLLDRQFLKRLADREINKVAEGDLEQYFATLAHRLQDGTAEYDSIFSDVGGLSLDDLYVSGVLIGHPWQKGRLYHWDGYKLTDLPLRAPDALTKIAVQDADNIWVCGRSGQLLHGNARDGFLPAPGLSGDQMFISISYHNSRVFLASGFPQQSLFVYENSRLKPLMTGLVPEPSNMFYIEHVDGVIWAVGVKDIVRFDGDRWERIDHPDNPPIR